MTGLRRDVATLGPGWNKTLYHYALAMAELDKLPITNRNSWKFLAAMHGFDPQGWVEFQVLSPTEPVPAELTDERRYGNQCQHGSWYFLPWHRAYLSTFETVVAAKVKELTGEDWALPYWNYLNAANPDARRIPEVFLEELLPDRTPNPLRRYPRSPGVAELPAGPRLNLSAMSEPDFLVGPDGSIGFGGGITGDFQQFWGMTGDLESNPHNPVHGMVGGFMGNALYAGLDPLFWLHHCNIDRLWEAWMNTPGKAMVTEASWRNGPADRTFLMPALGGADPGISFTPRETLKGGPFHPTYDDLRTGTGVTPGAVTVAHFGMGPADQQQVRLVGANSQRVTVGSDVAQTRLDMEPQAAAGVTSMGASTPGTRVTRLYLALESVRGDSPSPVLDVYVNLPDGASQRDHPELRADSLTLFGLNVASKPDGSHGGNGLGYRIEITELAERLKAKGDFDPERLRVTLVPVEGISDGAPLTVERISVLTRSGIVS